jgi:hypothetical protein
MQHNPRKNINIKGGMKVVSLERYCSSDGVLDIFFIYKGTPSWTWQKRFAAI